MTKTRPSSNHPSQFRRREAEQGSWSDSEDSMGYHVHYLPTTTVVTPANHPAPPAPKPVTVEPTMTTISIGGILTKIPANLATAAWSGTRAVTTKEENEDKKGEKLIHVQSCNTPDDDYPESTGCRGLRPSEDASSPQHIPTMPITQSLINRGLYKAPNSSEPSNILGTEPVPPPPQPKGLDDFRSNRAWSGGEATKHRPIMPITQSLINRGLYEDPNNTAPTTVLGTQPVTPPTPPKGPDGFATSRPWNDAEAMVGHAKPASKQHTDERGSYASCAAVSPAVVLAGLSAEDEVVPAEATMQKYGRILRELPGEESRKVRALMESIYELSPSNSLGEDKWYLSAIGALIGSGQPEYIADLYVYICSNPGYQTSTQRRALARRMREALFKCIPVNGIAVVTEAVTALASVEELYDQDHGTRWAGNQITPEKLDRTRATIAQLHGSEHVKEVYAACGSHEDLAWINENIVYGMFLADHSILSVEETELVVLPAFVSTGLKGPAEAHLKAALRLGMGVEEVEHIHRISEMLAGWKGTSLTLMKRAKDL